MVKCISMRQTKMKTYKTFCEDLSKQIDTGRGTDHPGNPFDPNIKKRDPKWAKHIRKQAEARWAKGQSAFSKSYLDNKK